MSFTVTASTLRACPALRLDVEHYRTTHGRCRCFDPPQLAARARLLREEARLLVAEARRLEAS